MAVGKRAQGGKELRAHRASKRLTQRQTILAKCYDCTGGYADGRSDCGMPGCPLHPWMPFREARKSREIASVTP